MENIQQEFLKKLEEIREVRLELIYEKGEKVVLPPWVIWAKSPEDRLLEPGFLFQYEARFAKPLTSDQFTIIKELMSFLETEGYLNLSYMYLDATYFFFQGSLTEKIPESPTVSELKTWFMDFYATYGIAVEFHEIYEVAPNWLFLAVVGFAGLVGLVGIAAYASPKSES